MKIVTLVMMVLMTGFAHAQESTDSKLKSAPVPEVKRTTLGLYVTAGEAYHKWVQDPEHVKILDVRTPEEYVFVGHASMARNIPFLFIYHQWDDEKNAPVMKPNPGFADAVKRQYKPGDTLLVMCRSGGRSKKAVDLLAKAGFTKVYNVIDGMEGDSVKDVASVYHGKRMKNGWKNSGVPWTYKLDAGLMYVKSPQK